MNVIFPSSIEDGPSLIHTDLNKSKQVSEEHSVHAPRPTITSNTVLLDAARLHEMLIGDDDISAHDFLLSESFNLSVLKTLLHLHSLDDKQRTARLKEAEAQLAEVGRKKREQTRKALEAKRANSNIPKIKAWLFALELEGENIGERHIAGKISLKFGVTATHARNIRTQYLSEKTKKAQQSSGSFV